MRLDLRHDGGRQAGDARSGMTDRTDSPRLAALRSLEESLLSHRRAQAVPVMAAADEPTGLSRGARLALMIESIVCVPAFVRGRRMRRFLIGVATVIALVALAAGALLYRLSSGPISLDFATDWLAAAIKQNLGNRYSV